MGLFSQLFRRKPETSNGGKQKVIQNGEWIIHLNVVGEPTQFYKKGKEWLDPSNTWTSPSGRFFLHSGIDGNADDCIALTTQTEGLKIKKMDEGIESAIVLDSGTAHVLTEDGNLYTINSEKSSQRHLCDDRPEAYLMTTDICADAYEGDTENVVVKAVHFETGKGWQRKLGYEWPDDGNNSDVSIVSDPTGIAITTPDGKMHHLSLEGQPIK